MNQCSLCRKRFDKPLFQCQVLKEGWHGYGADPDYKMIDGFKTLGLCFECKETPTKFSKELLKESPYLKKWNTYPIPLMTFEKEKELNKRWIGNRLTPREERVFKQLEELEESKTNSKTG